MILQDMMIDRLRGICSQDERLTGAMLYGSFTRGEADEFSDIDTVLFFADESLPEIDQQAWVSQIAPIELYYHNEFGNGVAIFSNLVRAEFHFYGDGEMQKKIEGWRGDVWFPSLADVILVDKNGQLARQIGPLIGTPPTHQTAQDIRFLCDSFLNWYLFGANVLARGELARALELLNLIHDYLLRMARLVEGVPERWISPTKALEQEISVEVYRRFQACTAPLESNALWNAYLSAWGWGAENLAVLAQRNSIALPTGLMEKIEGRIKQLAGYSGISGLAI